MERSTDGNPLGSERSRASGDPPLQNAQSQSQPKHSTQNSSFTAHGSGSQYNAPHGIQSISTGNGPQFPGSNFQGPVYFGTEKHFDPLRDCLRSLAFPEIDSRFHDVDTAAQGTCQWLLRHKMYTSWASCDRGLLWIKGKPGSGKSTLLRYALTNIMEIPNTGEGALVLSFFFHGRGSELQKTPLGLFRSLLHQLLRQVPEALTDLVATFQQRCETVGKPGEQWQWHPRELHQFFELSLLKVLETRPVWLLVDALNECGNENAVTLAEELKSLLERLPSSGLKQFHICFTCRHYPILYLDGVFEIYIEEENWKDISTFVQDKLTSFSSTIGNLITKRADGVFLWARLVVKQILGLEWKGAKLKEIEAVILSVPQELDVLYRDLIRDMTSASLKLIEWICFATRPLSLDELRWAMLVDANYPHQSLYECQSAGDYPSDDNGMKRRVQTLSCGLAEVTSDTKVVRFIHQSVKDFFVEKGLSALNVTAKPDLVVGIAHHRLSRTCIRYVAMEEIGRSASHKRDDMISEFPFLHYATTSWVAHTKQSYARGVPQEDLLEYFAGPSNTLIERWARIYRILEEYSDYCPPEGTSLVHVISRYGVAGALRAILKRADQVGININSKDSDGRTSMSYAAEYGHKAVVWLFLDYGAYVEAADKKGQTPLLYAVKKGHNAVVQLLLDRGAYIEAADKDDRTPLSYAAEGGHEAVVRLLLDRGAYIEAADKEGKTSLSWAAENRRETVVRLLLDRGAYIEAADEEGRTPLWYAAEGGHEAVVRLLLDRGAYIEAADKEGRTPLWYAAKGGHEAVVQLLLDRSAYIKAADKEGKMPLSWAAENGRETVVRLLLDRGAYIEAADEEGRTPLWYAAEGGYETVVRLLLDRGAYIEAADKDDRTPLSYAAEGGHEAIIRLLLDRGAYIEAADKKGQTPLLKAVQYRHEAVVWLLLGQGADIEAADKEGRTPLWYAAEGGHEAVIRLLLNRGAYVEAADEDGRTPLSYATEYGYEAVVRLFLEGGARTEAADQDDSEIESICDSVFTEASISSSQVSAGDRSWNLVWDFAQLLLKHEELKDLYPRAISQVGTDRFERNFHRLLKKFGRDLRKEANSPQQQQAAIFVRYNAKRTAAELTRNLRQADEEPKSRGELGPSEPTVSKTAQVDEWVRRAIDQGPADVGSADGLLQAEGDWDDLPASESSGSERDEQISGVTIQEMKDFMVSAGAFSVLRQEFRVWLKLETRKNENDSKDDPEKSPVESQGEDVITGPDEAKADLETGQVPGSPISDVKSPNPDQEGHDDDDDESLENDDEAPSSVPERTTRWPSLRLWLWNLYCPPPLGFQRISYTCGCGEFTYLDVRELSPGGVERFRRELLESTAAVRSRTGSVAKRGCHPDWPAPLQPMHSNSESRLSSSRGPARRLPSVDSSQSPQRGSASASRARVQTRDPQYLLMCVNTRDLTELVHIEVGLLTNDQYLFERIRQRYEEVRKEHEWKISDAIPLRVRMLLHSISSWLPNLPQLPGYLTFLADMLPNAPSMNLHKVASGDFVKFQLIPIGLNFHPGWFRPRQFPPKVHVDNRLYLYKPVPMKDAEVAEIPLLHLLKRGPHNGRFWIRRFPKKLKDELTWSPEDERSQDGEPEDDDLSNTGWGIHINEEINRAVVLLWILGFLITVGVATIVYAVVASDPSAAWGLGAFVVAGTALVWPTLEYYSFKEKK